MNSKKFGVAMFSALTLCSVNFSAQAAQWDISITNLTHGNLFTPLLAAGHDNNSHLFQVGMAATAGVTAMAECGDLTSLLDEAGVLGADTISNLAGGPLSAGDTTTGTLMTSGGNNYLSIAAMILPTNDAFVGLDAQKIPVEAGTYTFYLNGYDAGTEQNDELVQAAAECAVDVPGFPDPTDIGGTLGEGVAGPDSNNNIHIHRGLLGDTNPGGGISDVNSTIHRWQNPVAKVVVTVTP